MRKIRPEEKKKNPDCRFGVWPGDADNPKNCKAGECSRCGWNPEVDAKRKAEIRARFSLAT